MATTLNVAMRTSSLEALRGLVAYGFGVSILSDLVYRPWSLEGKKIVAIPILDPVPPMDVGLLWPREKAPAGLVRSEEHTSEIQSPMRIPYAVICLTKNK